MKNRDKLLLTVLLVCWVLAMILGINYKKRLEVLTQTTKIDSLPFPRVVNEPPFIAKGSGSGKGIKILPLMPSKTKESISGRKINSGALYSNKEGKPDSLLYGWRTPIWIFEKVQDERKEE